MPTRPYSAVLFDLDGTIADSAPGITATLAYTFEQLGLPIPSPAEMLKWVGPPIMDSFRDLAGLDPEESQRALEIYRTRYLATGATHAAIYPGVAGILRAIAAAGIPLSLATSKPETPARLILERFGVADCFDELTGASDDEVRSAKADVVAEALRRLAADGFDVSTPVMVGDRHHDIDGAAAHDVPTVFVAWGYGSPDEAAGAVATVARPEELRPLLGLPPA